jgi:hypothetical protein
MNMLPFTNADTFPNIGLTRTSDLSGTSEWKRAFAASSGLGIFGMLAFFFVGLIPRSPFLHRSEPVEDCTHCRPAKRSFSNEPRSWDNRRS